MGHWYPARALLVIVTALVALATYLSARASQRLASSSERLEKLTKLQAELSVAPRVAIRRVYRKKENLRKTFVKIKNIGLGPANDVKIRVKWVGGELTMPQNDPYALGLEDERIAGFEIPERIETVDVIVEFKSMSGSKEKSESTGRPIRLVD